jgi:hypothetical protein
MHLCRKCGDEFPATEEFFYRAGGFFNWICKPCMKRSALAYKRERLGRPGFRFFICQTCGREFSSAKRTVETCSVECSDAKRAARQKAERRATKSERQCPHCGELFMPRRINAFYCSERCNSSAHALVRKMAGRAGSERRKISRAAIGDRDGWRCNICHRPVDKRRRHPDPLAPSIDHVIPLSQGGTNDLENLQLTHLVCNLRKRHIVKNQQLRLL